MARLLTGRYQQTEVAGITIADVRDDWRLDHDQVTAAVAHALQYVAQARGGFPELVTDHLRQVVVLDTRKQWASIAARGYYTGLPLSERQSAFFLACRLVWAATFIRLARNVPLWRRRRRIGAIRRQAHEAQLRFVDQFPNGHEWREYLGTPDQDA